jgi:hypothetical protein
VTGEISDYSPSRTTVCVRFDKKTEIQLNVNAVLTITNEKNPVRHNYLLHNHTLESVSSAKYLEITLQSDLRWIQHTNNSVANANTSFGFLKNLQHKKSQAYLSLVRPILEYACSF